MHRGPLQVYRERQWNAQDCSLWRFWLLTIAPVELVVRDVLEEFAQETPTLRNSAKVARHIPQPQR